MAAYNGLGLSRAEILRRIQDVFQAFLEDLMNDSFMTFHTLKRATSAMTFDCDALTLTHGGEKRAIKMACPEAHEQLPHGIMYTGMWLVLQIAHQLLLEDKTVTQRELYYLHPFFTTQQEADECILDVSGLLCVPRECLNIVGGVKGYFSGRLCYRSADKQWIDCSLDGASGRPISRELLRLESEDMISDAQYIIVVEKEGIFNRLGEDLFFNRVPCILVTGKGFPDLATRIFVKKLRDTLRVPVLGLCDCNPFGLSILLSFKFGSARMPLDSVAYGTSVDMHWIGLRPLDTASLELPDIVHTKFSKHDTRRLQSLVAHPFVQMDAAYRAEVQHWMKHPLKIELEALHTKGFGFITEYLEAQVMARNYI
ncbi:hypothetical protein SPRG_19326 [Saprolegnia parasitica CBS 223.65]|uniref:DNA topoisomerase (ATP-hydrolyzing) n=1 Tax=Saprolegnia parasitica (strain CBS 223.65) TaxID=695850 RepID=A0A067D4V8_SAPPC|nr:hypothetical protein SPRG_19326 [Saprolegnia parasitica CBS 223.65]KDO33716.1 hypothetical protein SPRG_19326 [Saprolegnia parasitica CBS 223.65]|eukprot:XP_012195737.1 hypothetical protein SPRG_19326 [Saprolegnia parasitica CBS 223.65]